MYHRTFLLITLVVLVAFGTATAKDYKGHKFKGTIESVGDGRLTLRDEDSELTEFVVVDRTDITREEKPASLEDLEVDDIAIVTAIRESGKYVALRVFAMNPE